MSLPPYIGQYGSVNNNTAINCAPIGITGPAGLVTPINLGTTYLGYDYFVVDCTAGSVSILLPPILTDGQKITILRKDSTVGNTLTLSSPNSVLGPFQGINGSTATATFLVPISTRADLFSFRVAQTVVPIVAATPVIQWFISTSAAFSPTPPLPTPTEFAAFFGMTAGPGNTTATDYPATIASSAAGPAVAGLSAINFPRMEAPVVGAIVINNPGVAQTNNSEFVLPSVGTYRIHWHASVNEPAQWDLWISTDGASNVIVPPVGGGGTFSQFKTTNGVYNAAGNSVSSNVGQASLTAQLVGDVVIRNPVAGAAIQVRNYAATGGTVTVTPLPGGTQAQSVALIIQRLA